MYVHVFKEDSERQSRQSTLSALFPLLQSSTFILVIVLFFGIHIHSTKAEHKFAKNATVYSLTESPEITCFDGAPIAVTWFKNGLQIFNNTGKYTTSTSFDSGLNLYRDALKINNFNEADIGEYRCEGSNVPGSPFVLAIPFHQDGNQQALTEGDTLTVVCDGWGFNMPTVSWSGNGIPIIPDSNKITFQDYVRNSTKLVLPNGKLIVKNVKVSDSKTYTCHLENDIDNGYANTIVNVKELNECLSNPCQHNGSCVDILHGYNCKCKPGYSGLNCEIATISSSNALILTPHESAVIACNSVEQGTVRWFRHGLELTNVPGKYVIDRRTNSLTISNIGPEDVGAYECRSNSTNSTAFVYAKPFVQNGKSQTIALGSMLEVPCEGWGFPVSAVTWYGDDQLIIPDGNRIMFEDYHVNTELNLTGGLLKIKNVQYSDYKVYKCKLDNSFGNSNGTTLVRIKDQLAALWPFIGIILELLTLCGAICWYERGIEKKRAEEKRREEAYIRLKSKRFENRSTSSYLNFSTLRNRPL